ncbi:hypothetical protein AOQ84DRAFT_420366 [Glonium stellatum]|uniref:Uncharacterized protein n=1 Tax=Glonium stellatum TaxID=574774 RepID=A0A8E2FE59_9PEZI|nr:hypothetical protein AOQ84DRAFT_420366 [Glonium stellatum]
MHTPQYSSEALPTCNVNPGFDIFKVVIQVKRLAAHSWEYGTAAQALLELYNPSLSVFSAAPFPADKVPSVAISSTDSLVYVKPHIRVDGETLILDDWGVSDPAALGVSAILIGQTELQYLHAARRQVEYLLKSAPRLQNGAISHRRGIVELWADFGYMVPPFLAYYSVVSNDLAVMKEAVLQCTLYRQILLNNPSGSERGLWHHIVGPEKQDLGFWSTSNGWMAAGMTRVLATICKWGPAAGTMQGEQKLLVRYIREIISGVMRVDDDAETGLLRNYLADESWFREISGTALLASVVYRMVMLAPAEFGKHDIEWADNKRKAVLQHINAETGIAAPAVQPLNHLLREPLVSGSPEGQSFVLLMYTAWRDCVLEGNCEE